MKRNDILRIRIERLAPDGTGYAEVEDRTLSVKGALPGDEVDVRVLSVKRQSARVKLESVVTPGFERIPAKCIHFGRCGGCRWQDVPYEEQCRLKAGLVERALTDVLEIGFAGRVEITPSPDIFFYRNKMEFSFDSPPSEEGNVHLGLHEAGRFDRVFDLERCLLQSDVSNRAVDEIRTFVEERGLTAYGLKSHRGLLRFLMIRDGKATGDLMINIVTSGEDFPGAEECAARIIDKIPGTTTVVRTINSGKSSVTYGEERDILSGGGVISERIGDLVFEISPDSFFQTNTRQTVNLYDTIREFAGLTGVERVLDLYCGTGTIGICLARDAGKVIGVESVESAVSDAQKNAGGNGIKNITFIAGKAEKILDESLGGFDVVICDPPRAGIHPKALDQLLRMRIPRMVYVSCNVKAMPADLERLALAGYRLRDVRVFDMSPHTPHVETVLLLDIGE